MLRQIKIVFEIEDTDEAEKELWESLESLEYNEKIDGYYEDGFIEEVMQKEFGE